MCIALSQDPALRVHAKTINTVLIGKSSVPIGNSQLAGDGSWVEMGRVRAGRSGFCLGLGRVVTACSGLLLVQGDDWTPVSEACFFNRACTNVQRSRPPILKGLVRLNELLSLIRLFCRKFFARKTSLIASQVCVRACSVARPLPSPPRPTWAKRRRHHLGSSRARCGCPTPRAASGWRARTALSATCAPVPATLCEVHGSSMEDIGSSLTCSRRPTVHMGSSSGFAMPPRGWRSPTSQPLRSSARRLASKSVRSRTPIAHTVGG